MKKTHRKFEARPPVAWSLCALILATSLSLPRGVQAFHLPLWEVGAGIGVLNVPHYRGSETEVELALPFPYIVYRGDILRVDREEGIRSKLFRGTDVSLDLSLAGSIPVPDTDEGARKGMPGLDPLVEAGAEMTLNLWRSSDNDQRFEFVLPYRLVYSIGDPILKYQGWTLSPYLNYRIFQRGSQALTRYNISFGPLYADTRFHEYFYEVRPEFATPERPAYEAERGYSGSRITLTVSYNSGKYLMGAFARYDNLDRAVFDDSPLVETTDYFALGIFVGWVFGTSQTMAPHQAQDR